jgi:phospholipid transport system substrate-binding protein
MQKIAALTLALSLLSPAVAHAQTAASAPASAIAPSSTATNTQAMNMVKDFYAQLTNTMKQGEQLGYNGRFKKLQPVIEASFNLPYMTRSAVGLVWTKATPEQQAQLVSAFSDFSVASYANQFAKDDGETFAVVDQKPIDGGVIVETTLTPKTGTPIALNYLMRPDDKGNYRIVDIFLDGSISQMAARRSEFSSIANRDGIAALVNSLGEKSKQMGPS